MRGLAKKVLTIVTVATVVSMVAGPAGAATVEELLAQIAQLQAQIAQLQAQLQAAQAGQAAGSAALAACQGVSSFDRNLRVGMRGADVKCLQALLNQDPDTRVAQQGPGSPGNETEYFGPLTRDAVVRFQEKYASEVLAPWGLTKGTGFVGSTTRAKLNQLLANSAQQGGGQQPTTTGLTVEVSSATPAAGTVIAGQARAELARFTFRNGDSSEVKVTKVRIKRTGLSTDSVLTNVYLYQGNQRLTDVATVSQGYATFSDPNGIFTVPAGGSVDISVMADISSSASAGQTIAVHIHSASDIESTASQINGQFPVVGNTMSVASVTNLATVAVASPTPSSSGTVNAGETDVTVWKSTVTVSNQDVRLTYLALRMIGSIAPSDLQNFTLYVNGQKVAGPVQMGDDYMVRFDLSQSPVTLQQGARTIEVRADIIGGTGRTYSFSLRRAADMRVVDTQYGVGVMATGLPATTASQTVNTGSLVVAKATDSPSGNVVQGATNVVVARYTFTAYGERVKVENLKVAVNQANGLDNGRIYVNGAQVGSTQDITNAGTTFNLGSSLIVEPGSPVTVEIRADIRQANGTNYSSGTNIQITLKQGSSNAQAMSSLTTLNVPSADVTANTVTVSTGSLSVAKMTAYGNQTVVAGSQQVKLGAFVMQAAAGEDVQVNSFTVSFTFAGGMGTTHLSNVYVKYGNQQTSPKAVVSSSNTFAVNATVPAGSTMTVEVYADISSSAPSSGTVTTSLNVSATTAQSGQNAYTAGAVTGQTITVGTSNLTAAVSPNTPTAKIVSQQSTVTVAVYEFRADIEDYEVTQVKFQPLAAAGENSIVKVIVEYPTQGGSTATAEAYFVSGTATVPLSPAMFVAKGNTPATMTVKVVVSAIATGYGDTGDNVGLKMTQYTKKSATVAQTNVNVTLSGNTMVARRGVPTVEAVALPSSSLVGTGQMVLAKIKISAAASPAGEVGWKYMKVNFSGQLGAKTIGSDDTSAPTDGIYGINAGASTADTKVIGNVFIRTEGSTTAIPATITYTNNNPGAVVTIELTNEQVISAGSSKTYEIVGNILVAPQSGDTVQTYIPSIATGLVTPTPDYSSTKSAGASFIWSDRSAASHSTTTSDWANDYLVQTIPTPAQVVAK